MGFYKNTNSGSNTFEGKSVKWMKHMLSKNYTGFLNFDLIVVYNFDSNRVEIYCNSSIQACELYKNLLEKWAYSDITLMLLKTPDKNYPFHNCVISFDPLPIKEQILGFEE